MRGAARRAVVSCRVGWRKPDRVRGAEALRETMDTVSSTSAASTSSGLVPERTTAPFLDLSHVNEPVRDVVMLGLGRLLETNAFTNGPDVERFERDFAVYCGTTNCVGTASGLDALRLSLLAAGIGPDDHVVVPANTFIATFEAVTQAGAVPVVVDITESDYCIDVEAVAAAIDSKTRAVLPVHLYGQMADVRALRELVDSKELLLIEDAAQAHGAVRDGVRAGAAGHAAAFSFYPGKNLGALGDAGALTTDDSELAEKSRALREHGQVEKYVSEFVGYTARLDTVQAIALAAKLPFLDEGNRQRRELADRYLQELNGAGDLVLPSIAPLSEPVWHLFVIRTADPVRLAAALTEAGVGSGRHYPIPPHLSGAYRDLGYLPGSFPVAEAVSREGLSLPLYPGMTEAQQQHVCRTVRRFFDG
jgi:dTDP-4-amino-4,6-dideoxygalactose transaminase